MKKKFGLPLGILGLLAAVAAIGAALVWDDRLPEGLVGLITGLSGALAGISGTAVILALIDRGCTPEERLELERGETDERNVAIREKAGLDCWHWTLVMLWVLFVVCLILHQVVYIVLSAGAIVLHCTFYLVNVGRWGKKL